MIQHSGSNGSCVVAFPELAHENWNRSPAPTPLIENGRPRYDSLAVGTSSNPNYETDEMFIIQPTWGQTSRSLRLRVNNIEIAEFTTQAANLNHTSTHVIEFHITITEWNQIYGNSPTNLVYDIQDTTSSEILYSSRTRA